MIECRIKSTDDFLKKCGIKKGFTGHIVAPHTAGGLHNASYVVFSAGGDDTRALTMEGYWVTLEHIEVKWPEKGAKDWTDAERFEYNSHE